MQLRYVKNINPASESMQKVTAVAWSPNMRRLAIVTTDRVVQLFDETGERRDKFTTKPAEKGPKNYLVRGMAFSPDSQKLAVAQSDNILFVYKLGADWGEKKSICNKFQQTSGVTCLAWPSTHPNDIVFGLAEGKVKIGQLRSNKAATLYTPDSYVVTICVSPDGTGLLTGQADGSVYKFMFEDGNQGPIQMKLFTHSCVPYALGWGAEHIVAAGNDGRVTFYDLNGQDYQRFDYQSDDKVKEFSVASFNPSGESVVLGNFNRFYVYNFNQRRGNWEEVSAKDVENLYTVTALCWKPDGSRLAVGSLTGSVDVFDACIKRAKYKGKFEFTYVSLSQVIVKRLSNGARIVLKSQFQCEVQKINIFQDRFLVAHTPETLLLGDLETCRLSEIPWTGGGQEKFYFENPTVCMIFNAGELTLVEYGCNERLGACRTEYMNPHLISVRINESSPAVKDVNGSPIAAAGNISSAGDHKVIAYLLDLQTIQVLNLATGITTATIAHDSKIDWLELNMRGTKVLFRDKLRQLYLYDIPKSKKVTLLSYCNYVQWVPHSDVVVAQNRSNLCVWYSIDNPERVTVHSIKGDVEEIERVGGRTDVIVDEGINTVYYTLDESLIEFGTAVELRDWYRAVEILELLSLTPETEAMWQTLSQLALDDQNLLVAERCFAALGDVNKARYLHKVNRIASQYAQELGGDGTRHFMVQAKLAALSKQLQRAEAILIDQNEIEEAMEMYQELCRWDDAIRIAEKKNHPDVKELKDNYYQWLLATNQEKKAGELKEREGEYATAISLYLKGGLPAKAAQVVFTYNVSYSQDMLERIANQLSANGLHEKAGQLLEKMDLLQRALDAYVRGSAYRRAVELARKAFQGHVVALEEAWGDWLMSQKQMDAAINHFIEAGVFFKAIQAAIAAKQWSRAVQLIETQKQHPDTGREFYRQIADHFQDVRQFEEAERFYGAAGMPNAAVEMYIKANRWDLAHRVAVAYMSEVEVARLYVTQAQRLEQQGKLKDAEKLYLQVNEPDLAINMYKKAKQYENMIRLVGQYRKDLLKETHLHLAQQLEMEGNLKLSEHHYVEAGEWQSCVNMYRAHDQWEEAIRVAKFHGGQNASKRVAYAWATSVGGEEGSKLLTKLGLAEQAVEYAIESGQFEQAFELARTACKTKLPEVHLKHALRLEDDQRFKEAEEEFIKANKPKEAIDMYIHQQDWLSAMRVAENHEPASVSEVWLAQARAAEQRKDLARAETFYVNAKRPELALKAYQDARVWTEALRVAKKYLPNKLQEVNAAYSRSMEDGEGEASADILLQSAKMWEKSRDYSRAIDAYLSITESQLDDADQLEEIWENAVKLAMTHEKDRYHEVVATVSKRLQDIKRFEQAAELYEGVEQYKEAVDCYMQANAFEKARAVATQNAPELVDYVANAFRSYLIQSKQADQLVHHGDVHSGLDMYAQRGEWQRCLEIAQEQGPDVLNKYVSQYLRALVQDEQFEVGGQLLARYGAPIIPGNFAAYKSIAVELISRSDESSLNDLKSVLQQLVSNLRTSRDNNIQTVAEEFEKLLLIAHLMVLRFACSKHNTLKELVARQSVALLRYIGILPIDRAFYEAGVACKAVKWMNMAFVFTNRYLDITEAMEDADNSVMFDNADFEHTDIPSPYDVTLPEKQCLSDDAREEVRDWVLQVSMDQKIEQSLSTRPCDKCHKPIYDGSLTCYSCHYALPPCVVTGYPVLPSAKVSCKTCSRPANKTAWNQFVQVFKACPWCATQQSPMY